MAVSRIILILLLALVCSSVATAQPDGSQKDIDSPGLVIDAIAGWDGTVDRRTPIPVSFLIRNDSDRIIEGDLRLSDPVNGHEVVLGEIVVAPGSSRRFSSIQAMPNWFSCFASLTVKKQVLWRRELPLTTGQEFHANLNFALFIDNSGRRLQFTGAISDAVAFAASNNPVAEEQGRPVRCLTVKSWQVPNHPGPLVVAQAIVFPEGGDVADLNPVQWQAVAEWMCQGGLVFVHQESREICDRLIDAAPLDADAEVPRDQFVARRCGLGVLCKYRQPLFSSDGTESRQSIGETIARLTKRHVSTLLDSAFLINRVEGRAEWNRLLVIAFFGCYTLFFAVATFLLFRLSQRRIGACTLIVVIGAAILAGLLGGYLRLSRGDLRWITVTETCGTGGGVQTGWIEVQSAGGRNTNVAIQGERAGLQLIAGSEPRYIPWNRRQTDYEPFTWQPNLAVTESDTYHIGVPMTPWGSRRLHATAFRRELRALEFELKFEPATSPTGNDGAVPNSTGMPAGGFSLKVVNHLPFDINDCWLLVGVSQNSSEQSASRPASPVPRSGRRPRSPRTVADSAAGSIDLYHKTHLRVLRAGATREESFPAKFQDMHDNWYETYNWDLGKQLPNGSLNSLRISRLGAASAWIIGRVEHSPAMTIDERRTDFIAQESMHILIQEIRPEDMPDTALFFGAGTGKPGEKAE
jgi:hypothetical protein